jgi:hypothetical protein
LTLGYKYRALTVEILCLGLYVKLIVEDGPAWQANESYSGPSNGKEGKVRVGDCLLDIQEQHPDGNWGRKHDVFAKDLKKEVLPRLLGPAGSIVELSFRRILVNSNPFVITVRIRRGATAKRKDIRNSRLLSGKVSIEVQNRFRELDADGSGDISLEEVMKYLQKYPLPGQMNSWESAVMLFQRADRDQSGSIDVHEFEEAFGEILKKLQAKGMEKEKRGAMQVEEVFEDSLTSVRDELLDSIRVIKRPYMLKLQGMINDPEDLHLIRLMYKMEGYEVREPESGEFELQITMLKKNPEYFWKCFLRAMQCLQRAQQKLSAKPDDEQNQHANDTEEDRAIAVCVCVVGQLQPKLN